MSSFRNDRLRDLTLPTSTAWLLTEIAEAKSKEELYTRHSPQTPKSLRDPAIVQSADSSNRIEGITVDRLLSLILGNARPPDRAEEEVIGYRRALNEIHANAAGIPISAATLKHLHALCQHSSGDTGQFKRLGNDFIQLDPGHVPKIRFKCVPAKQTPDAVDELCLLNRHAPEQEHIPPLIAAAALVLDFTCIHPFRDGNGRVSRLLALVALYHHGYKVGCYISLERPTEESKEDYYDALQRSSQRWHEGKHDLTPSLNFFLAIIRRACAEFDQYVGQIQNRAARRPPRARRHSTATGRIRVADLQKKFPGASLDMIRQNG